NPVHTALLNWSALVLSGASTFLASAGSFFRMTGTLAIIISLVLLMYLAYRGITVLLLAPLMAALAVLLSGEMGVLLPIYTDTFMKALGNYVIQFLPIFLLGALFGQLMADSGA